MRRRVLAACVCGAVLAAPFAMAMAADHPATTSTAVAHQVDQLHQQIADQKAQTQKLREQVQSLKQQQQANDRQLKQSNQTIERLHRALQKLQADNDS